MRETEKDQEQRPSKASHTPGPWVVDNCGRDVRAGSVGGLFVARIYAVPQEDNPAGYGDEQLANAYLIAAAPDLYKALKALLAQVGYVTPVTEAAIAAVSKAECPK